MTTVAGTVLGEARVGRRAEQKRRWDRENLNTCTCGNSCSLKSDRCRKCCDEQMRCQSDARRVAIQCLWLAGYTLNEIAAEMGSTKNSIGSEMVHMRQTGWELPYRNNGYPR